jgi:hypothetical protein
VTFATLFAFVGLSISDAFKGSRLRTDSALAGSLFPFELCHPDIDRSWRYRSCAPIPRSLCNIESIIGRAAGWKGQNTSGLSRIPPGFDETGQTIKSF